MIATGEVGAYVGEAIRLRDLTEREFGTLRDAILEAEPERMRSEVRGEELDREKFGARQQGTERLDTDGRTKVKNCNGGTQSTGALKMLARASARQGSARRG